MKGTQLKQRHIKQVSHQMPLDQKRLWPTPEEHGYLLNREPERHIYLANHANPFIPSGGSPLWHVNDLLLRDPKLRARSGVVQLDNSLTAGYLTNPEKSDR